MKLGGFSGKMILIWMRNGFGLTVELLRSSEDEALSVYPVLRYAYTRLSTLHAYGEIFEQFEKFRCVCPENYHPFIC